MAEKLTAQQKAAVENRGGQLLVSAAAGSGKTKVLVDRLLSYLTDPVAPANVDDFLIITYTKAAAAELRGKIAEKLSQKIADEPGNRHLQQQMQRLYMAKISTVHAFCADILRENAYRMDISADFRVADENECVQLQQQAMEQILSEAYESIAGDDMLRTFIDTQGFGRDDRSIPTVILKVYHSAMCHLDPEGWLDWCQRQSKANNITEASETVWGQYLIADLHRLLDLNIQALEACIARASIDDAMQKPVMLLSRTVAQLRSLRACATWDQIVEHEPIDYGRLTFSKKCTDLQLVDQIKAIRDACKSGVTAKMRSFSDSSDQMLLDLRSSSVSVEALIRLVLQFTKRYDQIKSRYRVLDFADLEHRMLDLLLGTKRSGITAAAREIGQRFREIMVDEYQDSNSVQDAIFQALTANRNNCFMVGDVKQSIYQFRLADPGIFIEKYDKFLPADIAPEEAGRKILLSKNFRSSGGVIQAVNDVFTKCMSDRVGGLNYTEEEQLYEGIPHVPLNEPEVELYGIDVQQDTYEEEATFVAERICQLLDGTHMVRNGDQLRPICPGDIVILLRSPASVSAQFCYALQAKGIACSSGATMDLLQTEEVSVLISLLQTILNPQQDIPLLATLASRVFGFTADDLAAVRAGSRYTSFYDALCTFTSEKAKGFCQALKTLRVRMQQVKLTALLEEIFESTQLLSVYAAMTDGDVRTANLKAFLQIVSDFTAEGQRDLIQFLDYIKQMEERGLGTNEEKRNADTVTIMSIHKSKGLEFPVVFLCGLSRSFNRESTREQVLCHKDLGLGLSYVDVGQRVRYPTIAKRAIAAKIMEESISEEMRVLYVAMTRPKDRLIMTYARRNLPADLKDIAMRLEMTPRELLTGQVDCPGAWVIQTALTKTEAGAFFALGGNPGCSEVGDKPWLIQVPDCSPGEDLALVEEMSKDELSSAFLDKLEQRISFSYPYAQATKIPSKQTATQLKGRAKDYEISENTRVRSQISFRRPSFIKAAAGAKDYGTAVHIFMQHAKFEACLTENAVLEQIDKMVASQLLTVEQGKMIQPQQIVSFANSAMGVRLQKHENVLREFKFSVLVDAGLYYPGVKDESILLQGVIDCAIIDSNGIAVIDYKTDNVTEETMPVIAKGYADQVLAYQHALERIYGLPVKEAYLYFFKIGKLIAV